MRIDPPIVHVDCRVTVRMTIAMRVPNSSAGDRASGARLELLLNIRYGDAYRRDYSGGIRSCAVSFKRAVAAKRTSPNHWLSGISTVEKDGLGWVARAHRSKFAK